MTKHATKIEKLLLKGVGVKEIARRLQCRPSTVSYHAKKLGLGTPNKKINWAKVQKLNDGTRSLDRILLEAGIHHTTWYRAVARGDVLPNFLVQPKKTAEEIKEDYLVRYYDKRQKKLAALGGKCMQCGSTKDMRITKSKGLLCFDCELKSRQKHSTHGRSCPIPKCPECKKMRIAYTRQLLEKHRAAGTIPHSTAYGYSLGCRCPGCCEAKRKRG